MADIYFFKAVANRQKGAPPGSYKLICKSIRQYVYPPETPVVAEKQINRKPTVNLGIYSLTIGHMARDNLQKRRYQPGKIIKPPDINGGFPIATQKVMNSMPWLIAWLMMDNNSGYWII